MCIRGGFQTDDQLRTLDLYVGSNDIGRGTIMDFPAVVVSAHLPEHDPFNLGVLVLDEANGRLHFRFRADLDGIADPLDRQVIQGLPEMIESMAVDMGALGLLECLEDRCSNAIQLGDRVKVEAGTATDAVAVAFATYVG